jgi:hypothetical protein
MTITITANDILTGFWRIANLDPSKTKGKIWNQKRAFKDLVKLRGGVSFIAGRPATELEELARRGVCSSDLRAILLEMFRVGSAHRNGVLHSAAAEKEMARLKRAAAQPCDSVGRATEES